MSLKGGNKMWDQEKYLRALNFAAVAHGDQKVPGKPYSYVVHLAEVAQEVMAAAANSKEALDSDLSVQCALLHDTIEDAGVHYEELKNLFGSRVADGVLALSKNKLLPKDKQMKDSLERIKNQPKEVWMVKLADRITNLQTPPEYWSIEKISGYRSEATEILNELKGANDFLADRLTKKIDSY